MKIEFLSKQNGFTLIELLASLAIFSIIAGLVSGVLINSLDNFEKRKNKLSLSQEANYILATLTDQHQSKSSYTIHFDASSKTFKIENNVFGNSKIVITPFAGQKSFQSFTGDMLINTERPLYIKLQLKSTDGTQTYEVETVINRRR
ncbi:type II secretion system GspH family protein [Bacillus timonensis]|nr:type II secretion system GspH family protein [Bacillus timonensis]